MKNKKVINLGLIGMGNIGCGVIKTLQENYEEINSKAGVEIRLKKIADIDIRRERPVKVEKKLLTTSAEEIIYDKEIDIVIELIGGISPAKEYIIQSAKNGKHLVTANKEVLAKYGNEILKIFQEKNLKIMFEASVCGGIPIISVLQNNLGANRISKIMGIVNGTTNYILSSMSETKTDFKTALKNAQSLGYAEANPIMDIEGYDAIFKVVILTFVSYGIFIENHEKIYREGISKIDQLDIEYSNGLGYALKLLAISKFENDKLDVRVHPYLLPKTHPLSTVSGVYNAVFVEGSPIGKLMFFGEGAGAKATSSAIIGDIISISRNLSLDSQNNKLNNLPLRTHSKQNRNYKLLPIDEIFFQFYLRLIVDDKSGVLAQISNIFANNKISLSSVVQKNAKNKKAEIVIITHPSQEKKLRKSIEEMKKLKCIKGIPAIIRAEGKN